MIQPTGNVMKMFISNYQINRNKYCGVAQSSVVKIIAIDYQHCDACEFSSVLNCVRNILNNESLGILVKSNVILGI